MRHLILVLLLCSVPACAQAFFRQSLVALGVSLEVPLGWVVGRRPNSDKEPQLIASAAHPTWSAIQIGRGPEQPGELSVYELNFRQRLRAEGVVIKDRHERTVDGHPAVVLSGIGGEDHELVTLVLADGRLYYVLLLGVPSADLAERELVYWQMVDSLHIMEPGR